jgi:cysteine desulfurase
MPDRLYLDHNATSPLRPAVREAMVAVMDGARNPSSTHAEGRAGKKILEDARATLSDVLRAPKEGIVFTAGGTEAINMALSGLVRGPARIRRLIVSSVEHDAVTATARALKEEIGIKVERLPVTGDGVLDLQAAERRLADYDVETEGPFLVAVMLANNETGVIQPVGELGPMIWPKGGHLFVDAVQGFGKLAIDFGALGADLLAIGAHKVGGPTGAGALVLKPGIGLPPLLHGGGQELSRRAGTENLVAIAGLAKAAELARPDEYARLAVIRDRIEGGLPERVTVWGRAAPRLPNTSCFSAPGFASETQVMAMDLGGIAVSAGSACSSGKVRKSGVVEAMGGTAAESGTTLRVSLGWTNDEKDADRFLEVWNREYGRITGRTAA